MTFFLILSLLPIQKGVYLQNVDTSLLYIDVNPHFIPSSTVYSEVSTFASPGVKYVNVSHCHLYKEMNPHCPDTNKVSYSKTCLGRPPLGRTKCSLSRQVVSEAKE